MKVMTFDRVTYLIESKGSDNELLVLARWLDSVSGASGAAVFLAGELELGTLSIRLSFAQNSAHSEAINKSASL